MKPTLYNLRVQPDEFQTKLEKLTKEASLETVWLFRFQFMKKNKPFLGFVWKNKFEISRLTDIWAYPVYLKGSIDNASVSVSIQPIKTAYIFFILWSLAIVGVSIQAFLNEIGLFVLVPLIFSILPILIVRFTKNQLINLFEYTFRNQIKKFS